MDTLVSSFPQWLIGGNAFNPYILDLVLKWWQCWVVVLKAVANSEFVQWRNREVEEFDDPVVSVEGGIGKDVRLQERCCRVVEISQGSWES
uniref:Uncharacterized protein n=1 Tax=Romanomermis culicivorax TaxID=13658 RepID=A0A915KG86_ROMCU